MSDRYYPSPAEQPFIVEVLVRQIGEGDEPPVLLPGIRFDHACEAGISSGPYRFRDASDANCAALEILEALEAVGPGMYVGKITDRRAGGVERFFDLSGPLGGDGEPRRRVEVGEVRFCRACNSQNRRVVDGRCLSCGSHLELAEAAR